MGTRLLITYMTTMPVSPTPSLRWVNEKIIDGKLVTLYRNEKNELVMREDEIDRKGNRVKRKLKKGEKTKETKTTRNELKQVWR